MVYSPDGLLISMFKPVYPVFIFCIMDHLSVFIVELVVLFVNGVVEIMLLNHLVYFLCELVNFCAFLLESG